MNACQTSIALAVICVFAVSLDAAQRSGAGRAAGRAQQPASRGITQAPKTPAIAATLAKDPKLEARVKAMLPPGMTLEEASEGFRNQGQFVAVLQASKNLDIDFADLKAEMTGPRRLTLGEAIQKLKP